MGSQHSFEWYVSLNFTFLFLTSLVWENMRQHALFYQFLGLNPPLSLLWAEQYTGNRPFLGDCNILLLLFGIIALLTSLTLSQWKCYNRTWSIFMKPWWLGSYSTYLLSRKSRYFPIRDGANKNFFFLCSCMHHICQPAKFKLTSTSVQTWTLDMKCHNIYILVSQTHNSSCYLELFSSSVVAPLCKKLH